VWQTVLAALIAQLAPAIGKAMAAIVQAIVAKIIAKLNPTPPTGDAAADQATLLDAALKSLKPRQVFKRAALRHLRDVVPAATAAGRTLTAGELADVPVHLRLAVATGEVSNSELAA
jgi:hypothetical protein